MRRSLTKRRGRAKPLTFDCHVIQFRRSSNEEWIRAGVRGPCQHSRRSSSLWLETCDLVSSLCFVFARRLWRRLWLRLWLGEVALHGEVGPLDEVALHLPNEFFAWRGLRISANICEIAEAISLLLMIIRLRKGWADEARRFFTRISSAISSAIPVVTTGYP